MSHTVEFLLRHGYAVLFVWVFAEQAALPLPSIPLLLACGALIHDGRMNPILALGGAVLASLLADNIWFQLGRRRGAAVLRFICRIAIEPDSCVHRTENAFLRYGSRSLLIAKFLPGFNAAAAPLAGISGMSLGRFLVFDTLGASLWISSYLLVGYLFSGQLELAGMYLKQMGSGLVLLVAGLLGAWIGWKFIQRQRFLHKLYMARITAEELSAMLDAGEEVMILDLRSAMESDADGVSAIPGALRIPMEDLLARRLEIPRDREIVLFCSCPNEASSATVALQLKKQGITRVRPLKGGVDSWRRLHP
jgi:membrane protein DedA with SNARE-associated domain/rhodanese-related sulfurtransferase